MATLTIEIEGQSIDLECSPDLLKRHLLGEISDSELLESALANMPEFIEVKESRSEIDE